MKIIFSRKGYDSASGGIPSPIFDDETFCSFPIPSKQKPKLKDVRFQKTNLGSLVGQLKQDTDEAESGVHLDPDLDWKARPRKAVGFHASGKTALLKPIWITMTSEKATYSSF